MYQQNNAISKSDRYTVSDSTITVVVCLVIFSLLAWKLWQM